MQVGRVLVAQSTVLLKRPVDNFLQLRWQIRIQAHGRYRLPIQDGLENHSGSISAKWQRTCGHLIEHHAEREEIGAVIQFLAAYLLRRHISDRAYRSARAGQQFSRRCGWQSRNAFGEIGNLCQAEIENLGVTALGDKNVGWLDVTVNDALGVGGVERVSNFDCEGEQGFQLQRATSDAVLERGALEEFHRNECA